jgi:hypothetical protein
MNVFVMEVTMKKVILALTTFAGLALVVACNSGGGGGSSAVATPQVCGTTAGYVNTQYGCLPECANNPSEGQYGSTCVPATSGYGTGYGSGYYNPVGTTGYGTGYGYGSGYPTYPTYPTYGSYGYSSGYGYGYGASNCHYAWGGTAYICD